MPSSKVATAAAQFRMCVVTDDSSRISVEAEVPSARNNNLVAESDLSVAAAAIHNYFEQRQQHLTTNEEQQQENNNNSSNNEPPKKQLLIRQQQQLYQDCDRSLTDHLERLVQPVSDEAFHAYLARYKDDWIASVEEELLVQQQQLTQTTPSVDAPDDDDDDEALMDHNALLRVQELRQQVREQAAAIVTLRNATLERSVALAERQLQLLWQKNTVKSSSSCTTDQDGNLALREDYRTEVQQMKEAVESMHTVLQETGTQLPTKLRRFHTTLHEIEQALQQQQTRPLSQIEKAIYHREQPQYTTTSSNDDYDLAREGEPVEQLLANLLGLD
jgi:hypothetical protein